MRHTTGVLLRTGMAALAAGLVFAAINLCDAKEPIPVTVARKVVEGTLVHAGKRSISVELEATAEASTEMLLPLASAVEVRGAKSVAELKRGDKVKIGVEQSFRTGDDGQPVLVKTEALVIVLLEPAKGAVATP